MIHDLFINMTILISVISLGSQLVKKHDVNSSSSIWGKLLIGIIAGMLGLILMLDSVHVYGDTIIDLRNLAIIMAAIHAGMIPSTICTSIIVIFRLAYFGVNVSSIIGAAIAVIVYIGSNFISRLHMKSYKKWIYSVLFSLLILSIGLTILLEGRTNFLKILLIDWVVTCIVSYITYNYVHYCLAANSLFRKLQKESTKDFLTGLNNVRQFDALFNQVTKNALDKNEHLSLLMVDIDFFKKVNDTYGHHNGDIVLVELGKILSANSRSFDIVSRNGGEEFTLLLLDCENETALKIAEKIRFAVEFHDFTLSDGIKINITISIGVASYPEITSELDKLLESSDVALYNAKRTGRNKVCSQEKAKIES